MAARVLYNMTGINRIRLSEPIPTASVLLCAAQVMKDFILILQSSLSKYIAITNICIRDYGNDDEETML